jgi:hypothetical protein
MSGLRFVFKTLSLLRTTIMLFIRSAPNCNFVRKNHQRRTILKRLFKLCSLLIGSYNINIGPRTTNTMLTSFVTYSRLKSMMNKKLSKTMRKDGTSSKGNNVQCKACGAFKHTAEKCRTPKHLVALYQKSLGKDKKVQGSGSGYEAHFSIPTNSTFEAGCSSKDPQNLSNDELTLIVDDYMDSNNTMVEYNSNDMFGDFL